LTNAGEEEEEGDFSSSTGRRRIAATVDDLELLVVGTGRRRRGVSISSFQVSPNLIFDELNVREGKDGEIESRFNLTPSSSLRFLVCERSTISSSRIFNLSFDIHRALLPSPTTEHLRRLPNHPTSFPLPSSSLLPPLLLLQHPSFLRL